MKRLVDFIKESDNRIVMTNTEIYNILNNLSTANDVSVNHKVSTSKAEQLIEIIKEGVYVITESELQDKFGADDLEYIKKSVTDHIGDFMEISDIQKKIDSLSEVSSDDSAEANNEDEATLYMILDKCISLCHDNRSFSYFKINKTYTSDEIQIFLINDEVRQNINITEI